MATDKQDASRKKVIVAAGAILICLAIAGAILIWSFSGRSMQEQELTLKFSDDGTVSDERLEQAGSILEGRFKTLDPGARASTMRDEQKNAFIILHYGNIAYDQAKAIATEPGVLDISIQTQDNQSQHILYGDEVKTASDPVQSPKSGGSVTWGVSIELTPSGAQKFRQACIDSGATQDSAGHPIVMSLDNRTFHTAPLSPGLASIIETTPPDVLHINTGTGDAGKAMAEQLVSFLRGGTLPARLEIVSQA